MTLATALTDELIGKQTRRLKETYNDIVFDEHHSPTFEKWCKSRGWGWAPYHSEEALKPASPIERYPTETSWADECET